MSKLQSFVAEVVICREYNCMCVTCVHGTLEYKVR